MTWIIVAAAWIAITVANSLLYFVAPNSNGDRNLARGLFFQGVIWAYWAALVPLIIRTTRRFPLRHPRPAALAVHAAFAITSVAATRSA